MKQIHRYYFLSLVFLMHCQSNTQEKQALLTSGNAALNFRWEQFDTQSQASLRGLAAFSEQLAWTSGSDAACLMSADGGQTWQSFAFDVPNDLQFRDVEVLDAQTAYLLSAGTPGLIYKTTDRGQHWDLQYENTDPDVFLDGMAFWDAQHGVVMGDPLDGYFTILRTEDGGEHWKRIPSENLPEPVAGEGGFAASGTNIIVRGSRHAWFASGGPASRVFRSMDAGRHWQVVETPMQQGESSQGIFSIAFADSLRGVAIGGDYLVPEDTTQIACYTADGGRSWQLARQMPGGFRSGVAYFEKDALFVTVGTNGSDYSTDFGKTWIPLDTSGYHSIQPVPGASMAWVSGGEGRVAKLSW